MGWSNPKTAMVYVKKSRMTSLSMSLYLANVQRSNCPNPFPRSSIEKNEIVKKVVGKKPSTVKGSSDLIGSSVSESKWDDLEVEMATQDLIWELEAEESKQSFEKGADSSVQQTLEEGKVVGGVSADKCSGNEGSSSEVSSVVRGSSSLSNQLSAVDPRLSGILQNLQNSGSMTIHFHFDGK